MQVFQQQHQEFCSNLSKIYMWEFVWCVCWYCWTCREVNIFQIICINMSSNISLISFSRSKMIFINQKFHWQSVRFIICLWVVSAASNHDVLEKKCYELGKMRYNEDLHFVEENIFKVQDEILLNCCSAWLLVGIQTVLFILQLIKHPNS